MLIKADSANRMIDQVKEIILNTKDHSATDGVRKIFNDIDCSFDGDFSQLLIGEKKIQMENTHVSWEIYKNNRIKFLESIIAKGHKNKQNLLDLIEYIKEAKNWMI